MHTGLLTFAVMKAEIGQSFYLGLLMSLLVFPFSCRQTEATNTEIGAFSIPVDSDIRATHLYSIPITYDVSIDCYFDLLDTLVHRYDSLVPYTLDEYLLVRANPWLIDSLVASDYYTQMERGNFVYDQLAYIILHKGDSLLVPDTLEAKQIRSRQKTTVIDLNIPAYKLSIMENDTLRYTFPVRVGRNERKYLKMAGREVSLKTTPGVGEIIRVEENPSFINPSDGKYYKVTRRDDGKVTKMPRIPWIEPELNGHRYGHLIHPTTNPKTLGKAYSNGCVGVAEGAAWRIYYYAPVGSKVVFRYDLMVVNEQGDTLRLKDIYR